MNIEKSYTELTEKYYKEIFAYVYRTSRDKDLAEDIVQETFIEAYIQKEKLVNHENPVAWLYKTAQFKGKELKRKKGVFLNLEDYINESVIDSNFSKVELEHDLDLIVTKSEKSMLKKYYQEGYTGKELAEALGITEGNLKVKIHRIKEKVKKEWKEEFC